MKNVLRKYYTQDLVNIHNKNAFISFDLRQQISKLRDYMKQLFNWQGEIIFLPNPYYAKKLVYNSHANAYIKESKDIENNSDYNFFTFTPIKGVTVLGFKEYLNPYFLGSKSISYANKFEYILNNSIEMFECGTQNVPLLLALYSLYNNKIMIKNG